MTSGIYEISNTDTKRRYIGSACDISRRFSTHKSTLRRGTHKNRHLQHAWNKYGETTFVFRPLLICATRHLLMYEQRALDLLKPEYNIEQIAGSSLGLKRGPQSPEHRAKVSAAGKGRILTLEHRAAISKGRTGIKVGPHAPEHAAKIAKSLLGNKYALGTKQSPYTIAKRVLSLLGNTYARGNLGKKKSSQTVEKMRVAQQARRLAEKLQRT